MATDETGHERNKQVFRPLGALEYDIGQCLAVFIGDVDKKAAQELHLSLEAGGHR